MTLEILNALPTTKPGNPDTETQPATPEWVVAEPDEDPMSPIPVDPTAPVRNPKTGPVIVPIPWGPRNLF